MVSPISVAAGSGARAGFRENKVLRELNGLPVLSYSLSAFASLADEMLVACRKEDEAEVNALLRPYPNARAVRGGKTRGESVYSALKAAAGDVVLVHDAARPFVTQKIIRDCIASVEAFGSGVCALPATDTTVLAKDGEIQSVPPRDEVFTVQTPQGFYRERLLAAYEKAFAEGAEFTDDGGVYARYAESPRLFLGDRANRKLTYAEDFLPAERVGFGADTHAFVVADSAPCTFFPKAQPRSDRSSSSQNFPTDNFGSPIADSAFGHSEQSEEFHGAKHNGHSERSEESHGANRHLDARGTSAEEIPQTKSSVTLGGVRIPSDRPLKAHSDGDVLVHALVGALLSAAGLRDIGYYFPDTDEKFRGADSMQLLAMVVRLVQDAGFAAANASISVLAETPRLSPYIEAMKQNLSKALGLPESAIGIAAGTNEKLGYIGEGKGITCYATVLLK